MDADDSIEELQGATVQGAAALSRGAEVLIRHRQDQQLRRTAETARLTEDMERRAEGQAQAAEQFYRRVDADWLRAATPETVATTWKGAHQWRELDPERFSQHASTLNQRIQTTHGFDPRTIDTQTVDAAAWQVLEGVRAARETEPGDRAAADRERDEQARDQAQANRERATEAEARDTTDQVVGNSASESDAGTALGGQFERYLQATDAAEHHRDAAETAQRDADRHGTNAAGLDPERDYDTEQRRAATAQQLESGGVPEQARTARMTADHLNGQHPRTAVQQRSQGPQRPKRSQQPQLGRTREQGRAR